MVLKIQTHNKKVDNISYSQNRTRHHEQTDSGTRRRGISDKNKQSRHSWQTTQTPSIDRDSMPETNRH